MTGDHLDQLLRELRAEQVPVRPRAAEPGAPSTPEEQAERRLVLARETALYDRAHTRDRRAAAHRQTGVTP